MVAGSVTLASEYHSHLGPLLSRAPSKIAAPSGDARESRYETPSAWTNYQANDANNAVFPGTLSTSWTFDTLGKVNGSLAVVGDTIYVSSFSKKVFALDVSTGRVLWSANVPRIVMSTPIVVDNLVIVGTGTNDVLIDDGDTTIWGVPGGDDIIALSAKDGTTVWRFHTVGEDMPTPVFFEGRLIFSNGDMHAYALDAKTGKLLWKTPMPGVTTMSAATISHGAALLVASHGLKYIFSNQASHLIAVDALTGKIRWSANHGNADCSPTVADDMVVCEGSLYVWYGESALGWMGKNDVEAFDASTGALKWRWVGDIGYYTAVGSNERGISGMVHDGVLYQSVPTTNEFIAFRMADGKVLWRFHTAGSVKMSSVFWGGKVIFGDTQGLMYSVDARTGQINNIVAKNQPFATSAPVIVGRTLFVANGSNIFAIPLKQIVL